MDNSERVNMSLFIVPSQLRNARCNLVMLLEMVEALKLGLKCHTTLAQNITRSDIRLTHVWGPAIIP